LTWVDAAEPDWTFEVDEAREGDVAMAAEEGKHEEAERKPDWAASVER
jgi:hypothetical protein